MKEFVNDFLFGLFFLIVFLFVSYQINKDVIEENTNFRILINEYEQILEYEYGRTFNNYEEYIVYRADKILGDN